MNSQQISSTTSLKPPPSFEETSKYFCLPLSDAANNLGVCITVLKKICRDNGLDRWPYRKFLAGKSIEDIKKYAYREKNKQLAALSKVGTQSVLQHQNEETSKLRGVTSPNTLQQQQVTKSNIAMVKPHTWVNTSSIKGMTTIDEFKYGFPSNGLSLATNKWWGNSIKEDRAADIDAEGKHRSEKKVDENTKTLIEDEKHSMGDMPSNIEAEGSGSLTAIRKRAVEEGREAFKLGVYRTYGPKKLSRKEKTLLFQIFRSSIPKEWVS